MKKPNKSVKGPEETIDELISEAIPIFDLINLAEINNNMSHDELNNSFEVSHAYYKFFAWREKIKEELPRCIADVGLFSYFLESDSVPMYPSGGLELSFTNSPASLKILEGVKKETKEKMERLRNLKERVAGHSSKFPKTLTFTPVDGLMIFGNASYTLGIGTKGYALAKILQDSKGLPFDLGMLQQHCDPLIRNPKHRLHKIKSVDDTFRAIRKQLKVNKGESFPIIKEGKRWKWAKI